MDKITSSAALLEFVTRQTPVIVLLSKPDEKHGRCDFRIHRLLKGGTMATSYRYICDPVAEFEALERAGLEPIMFDLF